MKTTLHLHYLQVFVRPASLAGLLCTCMLLAGCAAVPPATVEVKVPVRVPCVTAAPPRPVFEFDQLTPDASNGAKVLALARDLPRWLKYEAQLLAVVEGCK